MLLQQLVNGITIGSTYALVAIGFTMVFGVLELTNFSNGSLYMLGAYLSMLFYSMTHNRFLLALTLSIFITGAVGYCIDRFALRRLRRKNAPKLSGLITTLGMSMIVENGIMVVWGSETKPFPNLMNFGKFYLGSAVISWSQVIILFVAFALMTAVSLIVYKTKIGRAMRSIAQNMDASKLMGISINKIIAFTFVVSGFLACIAGTLVAMHYQSVDVNMGAQIGMKTFASAILGGVGVLPGAVVGGLLIGIIETLAAGYISSGYRDAIAFSVLIAVLLLRPMGLFGQKNINKV